jgi:REP element-mobilizing transposase RayT
VRTISVCLAIYQTYLITFSCYGSHLPGETNTVDRRHNQYNFPRLADDPLRAKIAADRMVQPPYHLDVARRNAVAISINSVARHHNWEILAAHVRSTHVHVVVTANCSPDSAMNAFKSYASRELNRLELDGPGRRRWARHGSTVYLFTPEAISAAVNYVACRQGPAMAVFHRQSAP